MGAHRSRRRPLLVRPSTSSLRRILQSTRASDAIGQPTNVCATSTTVVTDTEWTSASGPYMLTCYVQVSSGATLTIDPGVVVEASGNAGIYVQGTLRAQGTVDAPITFQSTSGNPSRGDWTGLFFDGSEASGSQLSYVTIADAGRTYGADRWGWGWRGGWGGWLCSEPGYAGPSAGGSNGHECVTDAVLLRTASPTFDHVTIRDSQTDGLYAMGDVPPLQLTNDTFVDNSGYAVHLENIASLPVQVGTFAFTGNGGGDYPRPGDSIAINGGVLTSGNAVTATQALTYTLLGYPTIAPEATFSLAPGSVVLAGGNAGLYVRGTLLAQGTADAPITFRSMSGSPGRGDWTGLFFDGPDASGSQLSYVTVQDAGRSYGADRWGWGWRGGWGGWLCSEAGYAGPSAGGSNGHECYTDAVLLRTASPTFDHVTIRDSQTDGLYAAWFILRLEIW